MLAGTRSHVDEVIRGAHRALVVLDDHDRVAEVTQPLERRDQPLVVALVKADRRLVEDVKHADERRPDLGREPDPLCLAARKRRGRPLERQVADPDVVQELQSLVDLAQHEPRDPAVVLGQFKVADPVECAPRRQLGELVDRRLVDQDRARLRPQPRSVALRARPQRHVLLDLLAREIGVGLAVASLEVGDDPLETGRVRAAPAEAVAIRRPEGDRPRSRTGRSSGPPPVGPARRCRGRRRSARRSPASAGRSSSRRSPPMARSHPRRSTASDRGPPDRGRSPSEIRAPCTAGRRRAGS